MDNDVTIWGVRVRPEGIEVAVQEEVLKFMARGYAALQYRRTREETEFEAAYRRLLEVA